jgi:CheY-like chemotaxis protein
MRNDLQRFPHNLGPCEPNSTGHLFLIYSVLDSPLQWSTVERAEKDGVYSIGAVVKMLGVPAQTLRSWEERYRQVVPARSAGGQRLYSRDQVDQLRFVLDELERGMQPADAHRLLADRGRFPTEPRPGADETVTILLAERDPFSAELSEYLLRTEGYATRTALNAREAQAILEGEPPSLVVIDLLISGGAGQALCRLAHEQASIPVVAVSAIDSRDQALQSGADAFLLKPLDPLQFLSTVRDLLGTSAYLRRSVRVQ